MSSRVFFVSLPCSGLSWCNRTYLAVERVQLQEPGAYPVMVICMLRESEMRVTDREMRGRMNTQAKRDKYVEIYRETIRYLTTLAAFRGGVMLQGPNIFKAGNFDAGWIDYRLDQASYQVPDDPLRHLVTSSARMSSYVAQTWLNNSRPDVTNLKMVYAMADVRSVCFGSLNTMKLMDLLNFALVGQGRVFPDLATARKRSYFSVYEGRPQRVIISFEELRRGLLNRDMGVPGSSLNAFLGDVMAKQRSVMQQRNQRRGNRLHDDVFVVWSEDAQNPWRNACVPCFMPAEDDVLQGVPDIVVRDGEGQRVRYRLNCSTASFARWVGRTWVPRIDLIPVENRAHVLTGGAAPAAVPRQADINIA